MRSALRILTIAAVAASPAWAGLTFTQTTKGEGGRAAGGADAVVKVMVDESHVKLTWEQTNNRMFAAGTYMLINEKGEMIFVNPDKRTYAKFDLAAMMENTEQAMGEAGKMGFKMEVKDPKVEKMLEEPGGEMLGYPTTHYRWHTTYTTVMTMLGGMKREFPTDSTEDVWTTTTIEIPPMAAKAFSGLGAPPAMSELRKITELAKAKMTGFPLKRVVVSSGRGGRGGGQPTTVTTLVTDLQKTSIPASTFAIPAGYTETEMMQPNQRGAATPHPNQE